ncbi:hypothetical protein EMPS_04923 [Entomortierella parvispora]|uniref:ADP/ATP translocase n=1 Tax=Entomortierella parvispora TaxID=205924 RepID=A0A9P3LW91_9FUNG|nr:hypothetical protein EMPS_04923 [Entomortierella parvispora]
MPRTHHHYHHHSHNPGSLGLGRIVVPLLLNALTAPTERVKLLLQSQDEIILNLREESLALYHHQQQHHQQHSADSTSSHAQPPSKTRPLKQKDVSEKGLEAIDGDKDSDIKDKKDEEEEEEEEEDEEPRSILVPYAQLPFTDMQDCFQRLVEKEGPLSLWRGYSLEFLGSLALTKIEYVLQRSRFLDFRASHGGLGHGSSLVLFSTALHGTAVSGLALLAVYPFAVLQAKMATDLVRRVKRVKKTSVSSTIQSTTLATSTSAGTLASSTATLQQETNEDEDQHGSGVLIDRESTSSPFQEIEAVPYATSIASTEPHEDHQEEQQQALATIPAAPVTASSTSPVLVEYEYELAYKFHKMRDALNDILASEGYRGLYKGFTPMLLGTLISRLGYMTLSRILTPLLTRPGSALSRGGFVGGLCGFMLVFMSSSLIQFVVYPLGTIGHRRMIAHKGRYLNSYDAAVKIAMKKEGQSEEGWRSLYKGFEVALVRSAILAVLSRVF